MAQEDQGRGRGDGERSNLNGLNGLNGVHRNGHVNGFRPVSSLAEQNLFYRTIFSKGKDPLRKLRNYRIPKKLVPELEIEGLESPTRWQNWEANEFEYDINNPSGSPKFYPDLEQEEDKRMMKMHQRTRSVVSGIVLKRLERDAKEALKTKIEENEESCSWEPSTPRTKSPYLDDDTGDTLIIDLNDEERNEFIFD